eukprot:1190081-Prorocentrum_minimum.AAC.2
MCNALPAGDLLCAGPDDAEGGAGGGSVGQAGSGGVRGTSRARARGVGGLVAATHGPRRGAGFPAAGGGAGGGRGAHGAAAAGVRKVPWLGAGGDGGGAGAVCGERAAGGAAAADGPFGLQPHDAGAEYARRPGHPGSGAAHGGAGG